MEARTLGGYDESTYQLGAEHDGTHVYVVVSCGGAEWRWPSYAAECKATWVLSHGNGEVDRSIHHEQ